jgi:hypothetical protein
VVKAEPETLAGLADDYRMRALVGPARDGWTPLWADDAEEPATAADSPDGPAWPFPALLVNARPWPRLRLVVGVDEQRVAGFVWTPPELGAVVGDLARASDFAAAAVAALPAGSPPATLAADLLRAADQLSLVGLLERSFDLPPLWPDAARSGWLPVGTPDPGALRPEAWRDLDPLAAPHGA